MAGNLLHGLGKLDNRDLMRGYAEITSELRSRGVLRSSNNPTGDYAEWLVSQRMGMTLVSNSVKGYDAVGKDGLHYQIKGRRITSSNRSTQLSTIRDLEGKHFDFLIAIIFEESWEVKFALQIPHSHINGMTKFNQHVNGHNVRIPRGAQLPSFIADISQYFK